ncbi:MAG: hypothetical protein K6G74_03595 [Bacilli bacterium]|nr:hypothetical protein [Bacilli bacterium]
MRKQILLPLFLLLSVSACASNATINQKPTTDRDHAILSLARYRTIVNDKDYEMPETLSLDMKTNSFTFHDKELTNVEIKVNVDARYINGEDKEIFPYAYFLLNGSAEEGSKWLYESWVYAETRNGSSYVNVFERGNEFVKNIRHEYVFESKRDWIDKAEDSLSIMNSQVLDSAKEVSDFIKEISQSSSITSESYEEPAASSLNGNITYSEDSSSSCTFSFEFENYCLKSYNHKKDGANIRTVSSHYGGEITKDYPSKEHYTLQSEAPSEAIR